MRIIDRYLVRQFLKAFFAFYITFTGLFVVIDTFGNLEEFISYGRDQGSLLGVLADYYGARALVLFGRTSGLLTLIAAMFTVTALERNNELTALLAAGVSRARIVAPVIGGVVAMSLLAVLNQELLIPAVQDKLGRNAQDWLGENARELHPRYDNRTDVLLRGKATYAAEERIECPNFQLQGALSSFADRLVAENAYYRPPEGDRPGGYLLRGVTQPENLSELATARLDGEPVILGPADTSWLKSDECFVASDVTFQQLAAGGAWRQYSSTATLIGALHNPSLDFGADVRVTIHSRIVQPFLDITLLFLGLPLVLTRQNRNVFMAIGLCVLVVAGFLLVTLAFHSLGTNYLISPALAAWCPLAIFAPIAVIVAEPLRE